MFTTVTHAVPNGEGWELQLTQAWDPDRLVPGRRPLLIVPGYGMNSFIFGYHPTGLSLEGYLVEQGFEVFRVDLRAQGGSRRVAPAPRAGEDYSLADLALTDLGAAIDAVLARARTGADRVDVLGASLGGTLMFAHVLCNPAHRAGALVSIGGPVRWVKIHPVLRLLFRSEWLAGAVRLRGTRRLSELALPRLVRWAPWVLSIYMNPAATDTSAAAEMVKTVEDPNPFVNREIARWLRDRDLVIRGVNLSEKLPGITLPLMVVFANNDGIVPRETATFPYHCVGSRERALLEVGDRDLALAHADLFISNEAHARVFHPMSEWLARQNERPLDGA